jgi:hypothetical protein
VLVLVLAHSGSGGARVRKEFGTQLITREAQSGQVRVVGMADDDPVQAERDARGPITIEETFHESAIDTVPDANALPFFSAPVEADIERGEPTRAAWERAHGDFEVYPPPVQRRHLIAALGASLLFGAFAGCSCSSGDGEATAEDPSLIAGRVWFEKKPERAEELVHHLFVAKRPARGAFIRASAYQVNLEIFEYERDKQKVRLVFPQDARKKAFDFKITSCDVDDFELCLELSDNPWSGPKKYYAMREADADALPGDLGERARKIVAAVDDE